MAGVPEYGERDEAHEETDDGHGAAHVGDGLERHQVNTAQLKHRGQG